MQHKTMSLAVRKAWAMEDPDLIGNPRGGPAYGEKNMPFAVFVAAVTAVGTAVAAVATVVSYVGIALTVVGMVTGNERLTKIGGVMSLVGGIGSLVAGAAGAAGAAGSTITESAMSKVAVNSAASEAASAASAAVDVGVNSAGNAAMTTGMEAAGANANLYAGSGFQSASALDAANMTVSAPLSGAPTAVAPTVQAPPTVGSNIGAKVGDAAMTAAPAPVGVTDVASPATQNLVNTGGLQGAAKSKAEQAQLDEARRIEEISRASSGFFGGLTDMNKQLLMEGGKVIAGGLQGAAKSKAEQAKLDEARRIEEIRRANAAGIGSNRYTLGTRPMGLIGAAS